MTDAQQRMWLYLAALGLPKSERAGVVAAAARQAGPEATVAAAMAALHAVLGERHWTPAGWFRDRLARLAPGPPIERSCFGYRSFAKTQRARVRHQQPASAPAWRGAAVR